MTRFSVLWMSTSLGTVVSRWPMSRSLARRHARSRRGARRRRAGRCPATGRPASRPSRRRRSCRPRTRRRGRPRTARPRRRPSAWSITPSLDQTLGVDLARRRQGADLRIHQRLGEGRIVALVVAEAAVAEHVHHHVLVELLAELGGHLGGEDHRLGIVAVDVEDRRLDHQGHVRRIGRGARVARAGGEADLVVDDEMHRPAGAVALQPHQGEALGHHALAGEGGVAVDQQRHDLGPVQRPLLFRQAGVGLADVERLFRPRLAQHHRVDDLEVRRVGGQRQVDRCCRRTRGPTRRPCGI